MNKSQRKHISGLTLTELLVSVIMVGVIMVGVVSIDFAMRSSKETTSDYASMVMELQAVMLEIERSANEVFGDASAGDPSTLGLYTFAEPSRPRMTLCLRKDKSTPVTVDDYGNDVWDCYSHGHSYDMYRYPDRPAPCEDDALCGGAAVREFLIPLSTSATFTAVNTAGGDFLADPNDGDVFEYLEITLSARVDNTKPIHPINNPEYTLTTRISPPGISR